MVTLQLGRDPNDLDLDFISPFNRRVRVPPFDNGPDNFEEVTLALHGDKQTLETGSGMLAVNGSVESSRRGPEKEAGASRTNPVTSSLSITQLRA